MNYNVCFKIKGGSFARQVTWQCLFGPNKKLSCKRVIMVKKLAGKVENLNLVGIAFLGSTVKFPVFVNLTWVAK